MIHSPFFAQLVVTTALFSSSLCYGQTTATDTADEKTESIFVVKRITTELQGLAIRAPKGSVFVLVNGDLYNNRADLPLAELKQQLSSLSKTDATLYFYIRRTHDGQFHHHESPGGVQAITTSANGKPTLKPKHIPSQLLKDLGTEMGFTKTFVQPTMELVNDTSPTWEVISKRLNTNDDSIAETPVGDDTLQLYPVLTPLSKQFFHGSSCVLTVVRPLNEITAAQSEKFAEQIRGYLKQLKLDTNSRITVLLSPDGKADKAVHELLFESELYMKDLDFRDVSWMEPLRN